MSGPAVPLPLPLAPGPPGGGSDGWASQAFSQAQTQAHPFGSVNGMITGGDVGAGVSAIVGGIATGPDTGLAWSTGGGIEHAPVEAAMMEADGGFGAAGPEESPSAADQMEAATPVKEQPIGGSGRLDVDLDPRTPMSC